MRWLPLLGSLVSALGLRSSRPRKLDALTQLAELVIEPPSACDELCLQCRTVVQDIAGDALGVDFGSRLRRHCAASSLVTEKKQCAGVTRMAESFLVSEDGSLATTPNAACADIQHWLVTLARDLHALKIQKAGDPACIHQVQTMTNVTAPVDAANFTAALAKGCTVSCPEVKSVAAKVLADVTHPVTPKAYCRLHEDWLDKVGIYDVDAFYALVLGKTATGVKEEEPATDEAAAAAEAPAKSGSYPDALKESRDVQEKIFETLSHGPEQVKPSATAALAVLAVFAVVA